jgi:Uma2 family endonuclease
MGMANLEIDAERLYYTADEVRALNEREEGSTRYECVYGELLVTPGPAEPHQLALGRLFVRITNYIATHEIDAVAYVSPSDVSWGRDDVSVQPDMFVVPRDMARDAHRTVSWSPVRHLLLAAEVISPSSRRTDRFQKRKLYQDRGVPLYWIVDPDKRHAELWTPDADFPRFERERLVWHPEGADEPLVIPLAELFAEP